MKKKILIAEDDPAMIRVLQLHLKHLYETIPAMDGKQALNMTIAQLPDLILMDIIMPVINGFQATRLIRQNAKTRSIPILAVTALSSFEEKQECLKSGCDDYIAKPFMFEQLSSCINKLLKPYST